MAISKENIEKTKRAIMQAQEEYAKMTPEERAVVDDPNYGLNFLKKLMLMDDVMEDEE